MCSSTESHSPSSYRSPRVNCTRRGGASGPVRASTAVPLVLVSTTANRPPMTSSSRWLRLTTRAASSSSSSPSRTPGASGLRPTATGRSDRTTNRCRAAPSSTTTVGAASGAGPMSVSG
ncbi:MAG: hypothetical protein ACRDTM_11860 [Micromonosporaceae bacterium]